MDQSIKVHGIPRDLWWRAKSLAADARMTVSQWVIKLIREAVEKH